MLKSFNVSPRASRIAISAFFFVSGFSFASWASRIPTLTQKLHLNEAQLGSILFAMPLGLMLTLPVTGFLLSKFSSRNIMAIGAVIFTLALTAIGFAQTPWQLAVILFCFGSSRNFMHIAMNAQSVQVQHLYNKSIIASFHGIWSLAGFAGAATGASMLYFNVSPAVHFSIAAALLLIVIIVASRYSLPDTETAKEKRPAFILPDKSLVKLGLIGFCSLACEGTMMDWTGIYFKEAVMTPARLITVGYIAYMTAMTAGRFVGDKLINLLSVKNVLQISGALIMCGLFLSAGFPFFIPSTIGCILTGFGVSCIMPMIFALTGKNTTMSPGTAIAAVSTVSYLGFLMGPPLIGYIAHAAGIRWSFATFGMLGLLVLVLTTKLKIQ
jgi:MFS family permease